MRQAWNTIAFALLLATMATAIFMLVITRMDLVVWP